MTQREDEAVLSRANMVSLIVALLVFGAVVPVLNSCSDEDLFFPGDLPATATAVNTATPEPDE